MRSCSKHRSPPTCMGASVWTRDAGKTASDLLINGPVCHLTLLFSPRPLLLVLHVSAVCLKAADSSWAQRWQPVASLSTPAAIMF